MEQEQLIFGPCSLKQQLILLDDTTDILLCGGGAGGGKSLTCLMKALKYINDPAARVMIVRRSFPMLKIQGGLWDESQGIYSHFGGTPNVQALKWKFANGSSIQFAPIPDNLAEWQGLQASHILIDEAAEFTQEELLFLVSRLRSARYKGHLNITMTCNPLRDSFLYEWVKFALDEDTGIPKQGTEDVIRYFINVLGKVHWANSVEELWAEHGERLGLVREHQDAKNVNFLPKSFRFIPLTIYDNPVLLKNNPAYLANLLSQPRVNQMRFLHGSWTAKAEGSGFFRREWLDVVDFPPNNPISRVRSWDLASSTPSETLPNPDWTAGVKISRDKFGIYYIEDAKRFRKLTDGVLAEIISTGGEDGKDSTVLTIPKDPGASGKIANQFFIRTLAESGLIVKSVVVSGHSGKLQRFLPFCSLAESGAVKIVRGDWNEEFLAELEDFTNSRKQKDDQVDATSDAFNTLSKQVLLPTFSIPSLDGGTVVPEVR